MQLVLEPIACEKDARGMETNFQKGNFYTTSHDAKRCIHISGIALGQVRRLKNLISAPRSKGQVRGKVKLCVDTFIRSFKSFLKMSCCHT